VSGDKSRRLKMELKSKGVWLGCGIPVAVTGLLVLLLGFYFVGGYGMASSINRGYEDGNCQPALQLGQYLEQFYPQAIAPFAEQALLNTEECRVYTEATLLEDAGECELAHQAYEAYVKAYPDGKFVEQAVENAAQNLLIWGENLFEDGQTQKAIQAFERLLKIYPESEAAETAIQALPEASDNGDSSTPREPEPTEASDNRVTIVLDKLYRADTIPPDIVQALSTSQRPYEAPTQAEECDYVFIHVTITRIENVHMIDGLGHEGEETALLSARAHEYPLIAGQLQGMRLVDPDDFATSPVEVTEGATAFWVFEVPKDEKPSKLEFVYSFQKDWEEETAKRGQLDMVLP
jgi:tetratricopeptide (TPR) repeat protein